MTHTHTQFKYR